MIPNAHDCPLACSKCEDTPLTRCPMLRWDFDYWCSPHPEPNADSLAALDILTIRREFWEAVKRLDEMLGGEKE